MYVAKFEEAVYVLHCFQKKTQATTKQDKEIATARYRAVVECEKGQVMNVDTEIRHVTKAGANLFLELGFTAAEAKKLHERRASRSTTRACSSSN